MYKQLLAACCAAGALTVAAVPAGATVIGTVYQNQADAGSLTGNLSADLDSMGGSADFTVNNILFSNPDDASTLGFFSNGGLSQFVGFTGAKHGFDPNATFNNTITVLRGMTYLAAGANSFVVGHDDGVVLKIPGISYTLQDGGPTSFTTTPFTVANTHGAGLYAFTLEYGECCGPPAGLEFTINGAPVGVPEPVSAAVLTIGVLACAGLRRRRLSV